MKKYCFIFFMAVCMRSSAQELFSYTEPASNMPTRSIGLRVSNYLMKETVTGRTNYHLLPEIMWGASKQLMLHAEGFFSDRTTKLSAEGIGFYAKYRFLSIDEVHSHFRMAAFARVSFNNSKIDQEEIDINGFNSGYQAGLIATQLLHKTALSATMSYIRAGDNGITNKYPSSQARDAMNYTLSLGHLVLPKTYTDYKQVNLNLMLELLGQDIPSAGRSFLDIAPTAQMIINSQFRIDIGYRQQLYSNMLRTAPNGFMLRFEYLLFNVLK